MVDELGTTVGLVSLEDILEEILGRVPDTGEVIESSGHQVEVLAADDARILELRIVRGGASRS